MSTSKPDNKGNRIQADSHATEVETAGLSDDLFAAPSLAAKVSTLSELATLTGVSVSTVSKALSDRGYVSAKTRERIRRIADEHGFQINRTAQSLKRGRNDAIAVVLPLGHESAQTFSDPFFITLIGHLADALSARNNELVLSKVVPDGPGWLANVARSGRVDGIVVIGQSNQEHELERVADFYRPLVVWGQQLQGQRYCSVGTDNRAGGRLAAGQLLGIGRRKLTFVGMTDIPEIAERHAGFTEACRAAGASSSGHIPAHLTADAAYQAVADALDAGLSTDGMVAASDVIAMSAMRALSERGFVVPEQVAVIGYDDVSLAAFTTPPLTTVRQELEIAAVNLVDLLFRRIRGEDTASISMPPRLMIRGTA